MVLVALQEPYLLLMACDDRGDDKAANILLFISFYRGYWCPEGDLNPHDRLRSADFKSAVSADFTIRAGSEECRFLILTHQPGFHRFRNYSAQIAYIKSMCSS